MERKCSSSKNTKIMKTTYSKPQLISTEMQYQGVIAGTLGAKNETTSNGVYENERRGDWGDVWQEGEKEK